MAAIERLYREAIGGAAWLPPDARAVVDFAAVVHDEVIHVVETKADAVAGFVSVHVPDAFIHHLFIAPHCQRRGLAASLLASLHTWLPTPWQLKCVRANANALAFYATNGWHEIAAGDGDDGPYALLEFRGSA